MADIYIVNSLVIILFFFAAACFYLLIKLFKREMNCHLLNMELDRLNKKIKAIENGKSVGENG